MREGNIRSLTNFKTMSRFIYSIIEKEEKSFLLPIPITDKWEWSFAEHVKTTVHYKNSIFNTGANDNKPFKNILRPILNLQYRAEGFDVKDILLYIEESEQYHKSFLIRKFHEKWARENNLDTFIDKLVESYVDFGAALVKKTKNAVPEIVPLPRIAFCDQSDMLAGPIAEKHFYSPDNLREEAKGKNWKNIEEVIAKAEKNRDVDNTRKANTPGKHIEVYEIHGTFPRYCLDDDEYANDEKDEDDLVGQVHICTFYKNDEGEGMGITLFKGLEKESPYKLILRDEIFGRALGLGGGEELFQDQIWTNYGMIRMKQLLDAASKVIYKTTDESFANRNKTDNLESGEILVLAEGKDIGQIDTTPRSTQLFDKFMAGLEIHARQTGGGGESIFGEAPSAGTPFKSLELQVAESHSLHEYRKGKLATFVDEIYRDWIIPQLVKGITGGEFLAELDLEDMQFVAERLANNQASKAIKEGFLGGMFFTNELIADIKEQTKQKFFEGGNKRFMEILKGEMKDAPIRVKINIVGKQKDIAGKVDKLVNIFRFVFQSYNPQTGTFAVFQDPNMAKLFNQILELSGLEQMNFGAAPPQPRPPLEATKALENIGQRPELAQTISNK